MNESQLWSRVKRGMKGKWSATRHTDKSNAGIPDVSYGLDGYNGWIELKVLSASFIKMRPSQLAWLRERGKHGGRCWVLLFDNKDDNYYMIPWYNLTDTLYREDLYYRCVASWHSSIDFKFFRNVLLLGN